MSTILKIWLGLDLPDPWMWQINRTQCGQAISDADKQALSDLDVSDVHIIIPGQWTRQFTLDLPNMSARERENAAGFAIEDQLAAPVADQHIAFGDAGQLIVIARDKMRSILATCQKFGLNGDKIYVDYNVVGQADTYLKCKARLIGVADTVDATWDNFVENPEDIRTLSVPEILDMCQFEKAINLAQGPFVYRKPFLLDVRQFYRAAALLCGLGLSWLVWQGAQTRAVQSQTDDLREQARTLYTQSTGEPAPENPALAVTRAVKSSDSRQADMLQLSAVLFEALGQTNGIILENLQYKQAQNVLNLRLIYPEFNSASQLETLIRQSGGIMNTGGVRERGGQLVGEASLVLEVRP